MDDTITLSTLISTFTYWITHTTQKIHLASTRAQQLLHDTNKMRFDYTVGRIALIRSGFDVTRTPLEASMVLNDDLRPEQIVMVQALVTLKGLVNRREVIRNQQENQMRDLGMIRGRLVEMLEELRGMEAGVGVDAADQGRLADAAGVIDAVEIIDAIQSQVVPEAETGVGHD
ncbi:uncharacterized protein H6S33_008056 [Morchella sextelata]|uniref:uncharacterized protein n=1 Tax=Morchella sextelata TaxID=1174677 RepID=UPI001D0374A0|nr:uncharacterized protein H6S33_008056 [Morchella sextelata]KAH0603052.1 hypothetical protein H6S33_008056 [Morchella sextelata]